MGDARPSRRTGGRPSIGPVTLVADIVIATCAQLPELDPDDRLLVRMLERLGMRVQPAVWNDPTVDWNGIAACIVRSTWDYHRHHEMFLHWIDAVGEKTYLLNPPNVIRWNAHKFYLRELENDGILTVPTIWLARGASVDLKETLSRSGWPEAVIKPAYGASADGILHVRSGRQARADGQSHLDRLLEHQDALLQPYLATICAHPERALVFIDGAYSHAVTKMPFMHAKSDLAMRALHPPGASGEIPVAATADEISLASNALHAAPAGHIFARVDVVRYGTQPCVLEVELIEPALYLYAHAPAAQTLARSIVKQIESVT
jgi:glutathione synthase/RimK-type ligase-like ATP-grasp enzyme